MIQVTKKTSLYEQDILLWSEETLTKLNARDFENLDLENLIKEIESLGISQKKELLSRLTTLLEHLLKRLYVNIPDDYNGWERTIRTQRRELKLLLIQVPSLKTKWHESLIVAWQLALSDVNSEYKSTTFPLTWQFSDDMAIILNVNFWE